VVTTTFLQREGFFMANTERKLALGIGAYERCRRAGDIGAMVHDVASLAVEASGGVNKVELELMPDGKVVQLALSDKVDVLDFYADDLPVEKLEKEAGAKIRECLVNEPIGTISVWLSPPGGPLNYQRGSVVVGMNRRLGELKMMEQYALVDKEHDEEDFLIMALGLSTYAKGQYLLEKAEQLRNQVFIIPPRKEDAWQWLKQLIPLEKAWQSIISGEALEVKLGILKEAKEVVEKIKEEWQRAVSEQDKRLVGVRIERLMEEKNLNLGGGDCGILNGEFQTVHEILQDLMFTVFTRIGLDGEVEEVETSVSSYKYIENCGACHKKIEAYMKKGDCCPHCGGEYKGC